MFHIVNLSISAPPSLRARPAFASYRNNLYIAATSGHARLNQEVMPGMNRIYIVFHFKGYYYE